MTSITLTVTGATATAAVSGPLTSGMVGIPVTIACDKAWNGLIKNLVCKCSRWGLAHTETRTILNIGETALVAHEVMQAEHTLYLGIEGYSADGSLVMPTMWASCGYIHPGANADADPTVSPSLPVWGQLQMEVAALKQSSITQEQIGDAVEKYLEQNPIEDPEGSCHCPLSLETITVDGSGGNSGTPDVVPVTGIALDYSGITLKVGEQMMLAASVTPSNATNNAVVWDTSDGSVVTVSGGLVTATGEGNATITARSAENSAIQATCSAAVSAAESGELEVALSRISVTYTGGDVAIGTALSDLTGIAVTAYYANGVTKPVTDYTLSGTIAEGSNIITVSYGGKTATFTVTGVAESTDGKIQLSTLDIADGILKSDGSVFSTNNGHHVTLPYTDGMQISAGTNKSWNTDTYPPVLVLDGGTYSKAEVSVSEDSVQVGNAIVYPCTATLSGYSADAVVHVSMLAGVRNYTLEEEMNLAGIYYYIPGGDV